MTHPLADRLDLWGFEDDTMIFSDGSFGFGLRLVPVDVTAWDDEQVNTLSQRISQFLNGLPSRISIQIVQDIARGNDETLGGHTALCRDGATEAAKCLAAERVERLRKLDAAGDLPKHSLYVFVRREPATSLVEKPRLLGRAKRFQTISNERLARELAITRELQGDVIRSLETLGAEPEPLAMDAVTDLVYRQWNPHRAVGRPTVEPDDVRSSLVFTDASVYERGFSLGGIHHRVLSLKALPDVSYASMAASLRQLPFDSRLFVTIDVPDQQKEIEGLQTQRRMAFAMLHGKKSGVRDLESQAKLEDLETLLSEMIASGEKVFKVSVNVLLRAMSEEALERQVSEALMTLRELGGAEGMEETLAAFDIFTEMALPNARARERTRRMKTTNVADFIPIFGPWRGHAAPSVLLRSRGGSITTFDPFDPGLTNANQIVSGGSGAGKSYLTNILLLHILKEEPRIFIIDIGGSYKKMCEALGGQYIPLGVGGGSEAMNPFDLSPGAAAPDSQKIKFLVGLVELMTKEDEAARLPKLERAGIEDAIQRTYEGAGSARLSMLREILLQSSDPALARYGRILAPWCGSSPYGQFVDQETTIRLERPVICFDLKGLETYPDLQAVCLFLITDLVWREVQRDRASKKFVVFDECWKLLENDAGASFLSDVYRTFRKYYASAVAISQNIDDFARSKIAGAVMPNSSVKWILRQKGADLGRLAEVLNLNPNEAELVDSLRQERGVFSEAFLMAQDVHAVVRIEATALEYWIATTDPRDLATLDETIQEQPSLSRLEVLKLLASRYPRGVVAA